jgi:ankyrin repeat protein
MDDIKANRQNAFLWAIFHNDLPKVKSLYDKKYIDLAAKNDGLEEALDKGYLDIVKYLVEKGAEFKDKNKSLIRAAYTGDLDLVKYLIKNGASVRSNDNKALELAIAFEKTDVINYFFNTTYLEDMNKLRKKCGDDFTEECLIEYNNTGTLDAQYKITKDFIKNIKNYFNMSGGKRLSKKY